jgi:hypothetical protein
MDLTAYTKERRGQLFRKKVAAADGDGVQTKQAGGLYYQQERNISQRF